MHAFAEGPVAHIRVSSPRLQKQAPADEMLAPIFGSFFHSSIVDPLVSSASVTFVTTLEERRKDCQEVCSGRGNVRLKSVRNSSLDSHFHSVLYPNDRDAQSAIAFSSPGRCAGVSGDARCTRCRIASAMIRSPAGPLLCAAQLRIHDTAELLSFSKAIWRCLRFTPIPSRTSHPRRLPAISRSLMVSSPR